MTASSEGLTIGELESKYFLYRKALKQLLLEGRYPLCPFAVQQEFTQRAGQVLTVVRAVRYATPGKPDNFGKRPLLGLHHRHPARHRLNLVRPERLPPGNRNRQHRQCLKETDPAFPIKLRTEFRVLRATRSCQPLPQ